MYNFEILCHILWWTVLCKDVSADVPNSFTHCSLVNTSVLAGDFSHEPWLCYNHNGWHRLSCFGLILMLKMCFLMRTQSTALGVFLAAYITFERLFSGVDPNSIKLNKKRFCFIDALLDDASKSSILTECVSSNNPLQ